MSNYLIKPKSIRKSDIIGKVHSLHPNEHKKIVIANKNLKNIGSLINDEGVGEQINVDEYLNFSSNNTLVTISNMRKCIIDTEQGENISPSIYKSSSKQLVKGDIIISRNASLGKITIIHKDFKGILNGGISYLRLDDSLKYYLFAFFIMDYGSDYLTVLTSGGGTQKNAKRQNLLDVKLPFPTIKNNSNPELVEKYISILAENLINKEEEIENKQKKIDDKIYTELKNNQLKPFLYRTPRISDIKKNNRLDSGLYTKKYQTENHFIENYKNGFFKITTDKLKSGSTPKIRIFNGEKYKYKWVTPTNINDEGFFNPIDTISTPKNNNLNKDCILFINRTSKGKKGEYVGITCFYDFEYYGKGYHNQGLYRLDHLPKNELLFIASFMNSRIMRKICGNISIGSKMKEMKSYDFNSLKLPKFKTELKSKISNLYYFKTKKLDFHLDNYLENEKNRNKKTGIYQLNMEIIEIKEILKITIEKLLTEKNIEINGIANT